MGHRARGLQRGRRRVGATCPTTTPARGPTAGTRTASAGICDDQQRLCFALSFWNGVDPILKERIFGLTGQRGQPRRGRQGAVVVPRLDADPLVDALGATCTRRPSSPTSGSWPRTGARGRLDPEFELLDTGMLDDDRYWDITADYAKASPDDVCIRVRVRNAGPDAGDAARAADGVVPQHVVVGSRRPQAGRSSTRTARWSPSTTTSAGWCWSATVAPERLFCENESNAGAPVGCRRYRPTRRTGSATTSCTAPRR